MAGETADYLITEIVSKSTELAQTQAIADIAVPLGAVMVIVGVIMLVVMYVHCRRIGEDCILYYSTCVYATAWLMTTFGFIFLGVGLLAMFDIPYLRMDLDWLIRAYEQLYGPLPEGLI